MKRAQSSLSQTQYPYNPSPQSAMGRHQDRLELTLHQNSSCHCNRAVFQSPYMSSLNPRPSIGGYENSTANMSYMPPTTADTQ